ncbi:MAG: DUF3244 domain-containing protein [Paramuribaculum sp.]|nr:DUF3244 domain-containing protein [Paramuribaculum sp.]
MKRMIIIMLLFIGAYTMPVYTAADDPKGEKQELKFDPENGGTNGFPQKPAYCPFSGVIDEYSITLFSTVSGEVEITVTDAKGMIVYEDTAELYGGYVIPLEEGIDYGMLYLTIGSRTYKAVL